MTLICTLYLHQVLRLPCDRYFVMQVAAFKEVLEKAGIPTSVRTTRGLEAAAACGQLRNQFQKTQLEDPQPLR